MYNGLKSRLALLIHLLIHSVACAFTRVKRKIRVLFCYGRQGMKKILIGVTCSMLLAPAIAEEWIICSYNNDIINLAESSNIERNGDIASTWVLCVIRPGATDYDYQVQYTEFDCAHNTARVILSADYSVQKPTPVRVSNTATKWERIIPGTMNATNKILACGEPRPAVEPIQGSFSEVVSTMRQLMLGK